MTHKILVSAKAKSASLGLGLGLVSALLVVPANDTKKITDNLEKLNSLTRIKVVFHRVGSLALSPGF